MSVDEDAQKLLTTYTGLFDKAFDKVRECTVCIQREEYARKGWSDIPARSDSGLVGEEIACALAGNNVTDLTDSERDWISSTIGGSPEKLRNFLDVYFSVASRKSLEFEEQTFQFFYPVLNALKVFSTEHSDDSPLYFSSHPQVRQGATLIASSPAQVVVGLGNKTSYLTESLRDRLLFTELPQDVSVHGRQVGSGYVEPRFADARWRMYDVTSNSLPSADQIFSLIHQGLEVDLAARLIGVRERPMLHTQDFLRGLDFTPSDECYSRALAMRADDVGLLVEHLQASPSPEKIVEAANNSGIKDFRQVLKQYITS